MWIPTSTDDLRSAIEQGLQESPWLDAKRELSSASEAAKDVAAMANEGGVLVYGVEESADGRLAQLVRLDHLNQLEERIANAVRDLVHNPPALHVRQIEDPPGSGSGYLIVVVPRSPLAPHMVEGRREGRYYGRVGTTTSRLTGAQVDLLMRRRLAAAADADSALATAGRWWQTFSVDSTDVGQLVVLVAPVVPAGRLPERAAGGRSVRSYLGELFGRVLGSAGGSAADVLRENTREHYWQIGVDRFFTATDFREHYPETILEAEVGREGHFALRSRGIVRVVPASHLVGGSLGDPKPWCMDWHLGPLVTAVLAAAGALFIDAKETGQIRCSLEITGLEGSSSALIYQHSRQARFVPHDPRPLREDTYRRHHEIIAPDLADRPEAVAMELLRDLLEALAQGDYPSGVDVLTL